jgi:hypothetical protein
MTEIPTEDILNLYASLMSEVKARLASVDAQLRSFKQAPDNHHATFIIEFSYLQLRRIAELTALAVLAAHNGIPKFRSKLLVKQWNADALFRQLAKLNPDALPQPAIIPRDAEIGVIALALLMPGSEQSQVDLCRIYTECGDKLHTGHLRSLLRERNKTYDLKFLKDAFSNLCAMLNNHVIQLPDGRMMHGNLKLEAPGPVHCRWLEPT